MFNSRSLRSAISSFHQVGKATLYSGAVLLLLVALVGNSLTAIFSTLWSDVGNNWRYAFGYISERCSPWSMVVTITSIVHFVAFWTPSLLFFVLDMRALRYPKSIIHQFRVQPDAPLPTLEDYKRAAAVALRNQVLVAIPAVVVVYWAMCWRTGDTSWAQLDTWPTFIQWLATLVGFLFIEEILFYTTHRLAHHPALYKHVHKMHHTFTSPIGVSAIFCTLAEHALCNNLPALAGCVIFGSHVVCLWSWIILVSVNTVCTHSGLHFPLMPSPEGHDYHHLKFNQNFGVLGILDYLCGTDKKWRQSEQFKRHSVSISFYPNPKK